MLPSRPPLPGMAVKVTWTDSRYRECLSDYPLGHGPLNSREVCDALRWIAADPWYRAPVSLGERRLPLFIPRLGLPSVVPKVGATKEDLLHEPTVGQIPPSTQKDIPVISGPRGNVMPVPKTGQRRGDFIWDGVKWVNVVLRAQQQTTGGDMATWDLGNITGRVIDIGLQALQSRVVRQPTLALAGPAARAAGAAAAAGLGVAAVDEIFFSDDDETKHRHRRKRLATVSDIKDLAALKAVFGSGTGGAENFKMWIATHSR